MPRFEIHLVGRADARDVSARAPGRLGGCVRACRGWSLRSRVRLSGPTGAAAPGSSPRRGPTSAPRRTWFRPTRASSRSSKVPIVSSRCASVVLHFPAARPERVPGCRDSRNPIPSTSGPVPAQLQRFHERGCEPARYASANGLCCHWARNTSSGLLPAPFKTCGNATAHPRGGSSPFTCVGIAGTSRIREQWHPGLAVIGRNRNSAHELLHGGDRSRTERGRRFATRRAMR